MQNIQKMHKLSMEKYSQKKIEQFKLKLLEFDWAKILALENTNKAYDNFLNIFSTYYSESFP